jgi:putative mRNA 3-end processing factor
MFYWDGGLRLAKADLALDWRRRQPRAFISHAHTDHMARHEYALCTPATAALYQARYGRRPTLELPYRQPVEWGGVRLTTYPAGHCLGSAMLLVEDGPHTLLYTGDFKLAPSATAEPAELPQAELLIMESTFGDPRYRLPPSVETIAQLCQLVRETLAAGATPVVEAYPLGKSQELTRLLSDAGFSVVQHRKIVPLSRVYEAFGVNLGRYTVLTGRPPSDRVVIVPPRTPPLAPPQHEVRLAVTGWALDPGVKDRLGVDQAVPLSDHADYDQLLAAVARVGPRRVYCTHGPARFVDHLRDAGYDAHPLGRESPLSLFSG